MRRGEIRFADLEPVRGSEANKRRPVVIVSNDGANARASTLGRGVVTVVPVTSNVARALPFQTLLEAGVTGLARLSKARSDKLSPVRAIRGEGMNETADARRRARDTGGGEAAR